MGFVHVVSREKEPYDRGHALGTQVKELVKANVEIYMRRFAYYGLTRRAVLGIARKFRPLIERHDEEMFQEMKGLTESTGVRLEEILALNVRYELLWGSWAGCTSVAVQPEASKDKHMLTGQNWDWVDSVIDSCHTWHIVRPNKPDVLCFTEAGVLGPKIGMNSAGLSLCVNGLVSAKDGIKKGVPFHLVCRRILNSTAMSDAFEFIEHAERAGSANYLIGHREGEVFDVETGPNQVGYLKPNDGVLIHTNHFLSLDLEDSGRKRSPDTVVRYSRCERLLRRLGRDISLTDLQKIFRDHFNYPNSICCHSNESKPPEEREQTNVSLIMDLSERSMWITKGNPCKTDYEKLCMKH